MNDSLNGALQTAASSIDIQPGDLDRVVSRGAGRRRRNKRLGRGATALVLVVSLIASVNAFGSRDDGVPLRVGSGEVLRGDIPIEWSRQETSPLGWVGSIEEVSGTLYTLSTAPGERAVNGQGVVWHSDNGINWSPRDRPGDLYLSNLSAAGDRLYAVGTTPATARTTHGKEVADQVVAWSDDGAQTWQRTRLPIDMEGIAAHSSAVSIMEGAEVAASERGVVVVTSIAADPDLSILLPPGTDTSNGWVAGPTGIDILASSSPQCPSGSFFESEAPWSRQPSGRVTGVPCSVTEVEEDSGSSSVATFQVDASPQEVFGVAATYTWDDLNVDGDLLRAFIGRPILSRAEANGAFMPVEDVVPDDALDATVVPAPDGSFVLFSSTRSGVQVSTSRDGVDWQSELQVSRLKRVYSVGWVGDRLALSGPIDGRGTSTHMIGLPSEGWQELNVDTIAGAVGPGPEALYFMSRSSTTNGGIAATVAEPRGDYPDADWQLVLSRDAMTWSVVSLNELIGRPIEHITPSITPRGLLLFVILDGPGDEPGERVVLTGTYR